MQHMIPSLKGRKDQEFAESDFSEISEWPAFDIPGIPFFPGKSTSIGGMINRHSRTFHPTPPCILLQLRKLQCIPILIDVSRLHRTQVLLLARLLSLWLYGHRGCPSRRARETADPRRTRRVWFPGTTTRVEDMTHMEMWIILHIPNPLRLQKKILNLDS